jgi:glycosyltransferase involved in cell wall biosynthesis
MRILHLTTSFVQQSAGYRLHRGLINLGLDSCVLVGFKGVNDPTVFGAESSWINKVASFKSRIDQLPIRLYSHRTGIIFSPSIVPERIISKIDALNPSIVHLHWICGGFIRIETLKKIKRPIVWTLHDSWAFTGGCHIPYDCKKYHENCGNCPTLGSKTDNDLSRYIFLRKRKSWQNVGITIITPSTWLRDCVINSTLFSNSRVEVIPNGIDISRFKPIDKNFARNQLSLPKDKKIILFGAVNSTSDPNKGFKYLKQSLYYLKEQKILENTDLVIFGGEGSLDLQNLGFKVYSIGKVYEDCTLAFLYSAADVFVAPSLSENLPNTILESLACGTPCVAFNIGGIPNLINHKHNGYLASPFNYVDFALGIEWILHDEKRAKILSDNARMKVIKEFNIVDIAQRYNDLYNSIF